MPKASKFGNFWLRWLCIYDFVELYFPIGDEAYRPVNLFARITGQIPAATLLLHSLFVNLLKLSERIFFGYHPGGSDR